VLSAELLQHVRVGAPAGLGLFVCRQHQLVKKDFAELLRRIDVKFPGGQFVNRFLRLADPLVQARPNAGELFVHGEARALHLREDGAKRQLDLIIQAAHIEFQELLLHRRVQSEHGGGAVRLPAQNLGCQAGELVAALRGFQEISGQGGVEDKALGGKTLRQKQCAELLDPVGDLSHLRGENEAQKRVVVRPAFAQCTE
jgi:hypothetical protein